MVRQTKDKSKSKNSGANLGFEEKLWAVHRQPALGKNRKSGAHYRRQRGTYQQTR